MFVCCGFLFENYVGWICFWVLEVLVVRTVFLHLIASFVVVQMFVLCLLFSPCLIRFELLLFWVSGLLYG